MKYLYTNWVTVPNMVSAVRLRIPHFLSQAYCDYCMKHQTLRPPIWFGWLLRFFGAQREYTNPAGLPPETIILTKHGLVQRRDNDNL